LTWAHFLTLSSIADIKLRRALATEAGEPKGSTRWLLQLSRGAGDPNETTSDQRVGTIPAAVAALRPAETVCRPLISEEDLATLLTGWIHSGRMIS
jgi:hypothetical protein